MEKTGPQLGSPPNIVVFVLDTARARNFSCYGHSTSTTNHIDDLAREGVLFENAVSVSPWTLPSHASLFTGVPPTVHRTNALERSLPDSLQTLAETLSDAGYRTIGMSANPWFSSQFGITRGFDDFHHLFGPLATDSYREFVTHATDDTKGLIDRFSNLVSDQSPIELFRNGTTAAYRQFISREDDGASEAVDRSVDILKGSEPYFLFINFLEPHLPYEPPEAYLDSSVAEFGRSAVESVNQDAPAYNIRNIDMSSNDFEILESLYDAEINYVDDCIGDILDMIDQNGQRENTFVAVLGDHGENIGDHGLMSHHYSTNHTLLHIPMILRYPSIFEGGDDVQERISSLDLPATFDSILRSTGVDTGVFQHQQMGTALCEPLPTDRSIVAEYLNPMPPIDQMQERCSNPDFDVSEYDRSLRTIYRGQYKLIRGSDGTKELYNIVDDPKEEVNLLGQKPRLAEELESELTRVVEQYNDLSTTPSDTDVTGNIEDRLEDLGYL
ncbi:sulfatase [Halorubrum sp. N11]|uniref:sulfatase n=1 Tax=Halorubrum sp. N11 TaxID=3402276 RepID=UPI003EBC2CF1